MLRSVVARRRAFWVACACALLLPRVAAASAGLAVNLHGDGHHAQVTLDLRESLTDVAAANVDDVPGVVQRPASCNLDDRDGDLPESTAGKVLPFAVSGSPRGPALEASAASTPLSPPACRTFTPADPFAPRPPPLHLSI
jgi:hypothetical protein